MMKLYWVWISVITLLASYVFIHKFVRRLNGWHYDMKLGKKRCLLPPGDMGWPFLGNTITFFKDFFSGHPESFINNLVSRYGQSGMYKTHLFGSPSIILCTPELCKRVLTDEVNFKLGYPRSAKELLFDNIDAESTFEHKSFRELITSRIQGHNVLEMFIEGVEEVAINSLEELSSMNHPIHLSKEMENIVFKVIVQVFLGSQSEPIFTKFKHLFREFNSSNPPFSLPIKFPGFAFHKALKVRKKLVKLFTYVVNERRLMIEKDQIEYKKDLINVLLEAKWEDGEGFSDEDIANRLIIFLFASMETSTAGITYAILYLTRHPDVFKKAKEEQEKILKARSPSQKQLTHDEIKKMVYLSRVINEILRRNLSFATFRQATDDININGYTIPKGWKVLTWIRAIHDNPEYYPNPEEFNPSRWEDYSAKSGTFLPFGLGSRFCPGNQIFKLKLSIILHHFLLNYKLKEMNPECPDAIFPIYKPQNIVKLVKVSR